MTIEIKARGSGLFKSLLFVPIFLAFFACQEEVGYEFVDSNLPESSFSASVGWFDVSVENASAHATGYSWDFGDGATSTDSNPEPHVYSAVGTYTIKLTATDNNGATAVSTQDVVITNDPVADYSYTADFLELSFENLSQRSTIYSWDFGDGNTSDEKDPTHVYSLPGTYSVALVATNDDGLTDTYSEEILVKSFAPVIQNPSFEETDDHGSKDLWEGEFSTTQGPTPPDGVNGCKLSSPGKSAYQTILVEANKDYAFSFSYVTKTTGTGFTFWVKNADDDSVIHSEVVGLSPDASNYVVTSVAFNSGAATSVTFGVEYLDTESRVDNFSIR